MLRDYQDLRLPAKASPSFDETSMIANHAESASVAATLLDAKQVARLLHVSESWVREHSNGKEPRLPAMKLGQAKTARVRLHLSDIEEFIRGEGGLALPQLHRRKAWF